MDLWKSAFICVLVFALSNGSTVPPKNVSSQGCGGEVFTTHGQLTPTQSLTPDPVQCVFTISTETPIYLSATHLDMTHPHALQVTDSNGETHVTSDLLNYDLYGKWFQIEFQSALSDWFKLEWDIDVIGCNKTLLGTAGQLRSPGYPFKYADNLTCTYRISSVNTTKLVIDDLDLETGHDLLQVTSVDYEMENEHMFYTGQSKNIIQIGRDFEITLTSDSSTHGSGFHLHWEPVDALYDPENTDPDARDCDGSFMGPYGYIESPNYPQHYQPGSDCFYNVYQDQVSEILVQIDDFKLAPNDFLVVNTSDYSQPMYYFGNYSISSPHPPRTFQGKYITMEFINKGQDTDKGFRLSWKPVPKIIDPTRKVETGLGFCKHTYTSMYGSILSPNYPNDYSNFADCFYTINVTSPITLTLQDMHVEEDYDYVEVRRFNGSGFQTIAKLTYVHHLNENLHWTGTEFQIYFLSDSLNTDRGFNFIWRPAVDGGSTNYGLLPESYGVEVSCGGSGLIVNIPDNTTAHLFPGVSSSDLTFSDPSCEGSKYTGITQLYAPLLTCGTTRAETDNYIVYKNIVKLKDGATSTSLVTRQDSPVLKIECNVNRETSAMSFYWPKHGGELLATGISDFYLMMDVYRDANRTKMFSAYPQPLDLNEDVYVDIHLKVDDEGLTIAPKTCYASPYLTANQLSDVVFLLKNGCPDEDSVVIEHAPQKHVYFRFKTFEFLNHKQDVYIFCNVTMCRTDEPSTGKCVQECNTHTRDRREEPSPSSGDVYIVQGPLRIRRGASNSKERESNSSSSTIPAAIMAVSAVAMVIAAVVVVIVKRRG